MPRASRLPNVTPSTVAASPTACVLHGAWLVGQSGGEFLIWAETVRDLSRRRKHEHPFHARRAQLVAVVQNAWPPLSALIDSSQGGRARAWAALPGDGERPVPSLELQAELDDESIAAVTRLDRWQVDTARVVDPIQFLTEIRPCVTPDGRTVRVGHDLRFWKDLAQCLQAAVRRHEYLPSIWAAPASAAPRTRSGKRRAPSARFEAGWELAESAEDGIVVPFAKAMPVASRSLSSDVPAGSSVEISLPEPTSLVRHFLAVQLQGLVQETRFPQSMLNRLEGELLEEALRPSPATKAVGTSSDAVDESTWKQWSRWRDRIQRSAAEADERICFRLADAERNSQDAWRLEWLLSSRRDPSLMVPLADFWNPAKTPGPSPRSVQEVLLQLGQAARIYGKLWEGMASEAPAEVLLDRGEALQFLREQAPILQGAGFRVSVPAWWTATGQRRLRLRLTTRGLGDSQSDRGESSGIFGFDSLVQFEPQVVLDGKPLTRAEWKRIAQAKEGLIELRGQWMELRSEEVARLEQYWESGNALREMTVGDLLRTEAEAGRDGLDVVHEGEVGRALAALRGTGGLEMLEQPQGFVGELRAYQIRGFSWMSYLDGLGFGACLADDMGLGKTVQVIATILAEKVRNPDSGPTLLIAPTSVVGNWQRETRRFAPSLAPFIHHGPERAKTKEEFEAAIRDMDMVIVSFAVARLDSAILKRIRWQRLVVDESQNIKNPTAAVTKAVQGFRANRRVALTGTPVENRLTDLWSLFSVLNPGYLGDSVSEFRKHYERPIMKHGDRDAAERLKGLVRPFILRRMKTDKAIISDLPDKLEQNSYCNLTPEQAGLYEAVVRDVEKKLESEEGIGRQGLMFSTLMKLKQICNHPAQFLQDASEFADRRSHKLARVCEMLDEIEAEGESALVFTQFAEIGKSLEALFRKRYGGAVYYLHGGTSRARREHMVDEFQNPEGERAIFVLSLRAGGTGITLTRANHVIHFDRWWNPAVENQATDRAYRIGQDKTVFVHKMVTMGTLEERIDELIESKKKLAEEIVGSDESWLADLDNDAFRELIGLDRGNAVTD